MWAKLRAADIIKQAVKKELNEVRKTLSVNEEYFCAFRTKSFSDFFSKVQSLVNHHHHHYFSLSSDPSLSESLLEPRQEEIPRILDSLILSNSPELKTLMLKYFEVSAEASQICACILKSVDQISSNHIFMQRVLNDVGDGGHNRAYSPESIKLISAGLNLFVVGTSTFAYPNTPDFTAIRKKYLSVFDGLKSTRKKVKRKMKLIKLVKMATGICMAALKRSGVLKKVANQLDLAAKGTYILNRDFDTLSRLVSRVRDAVEHTKEMIQWCMARRDFKLFMQVMVELKKGDLGFRKQVEELQEHVYLCLVMTINKARALVIQEMANLSY